MQVLFNEDIYSNISKTLSFFDQIVMAMVCRKSLELFKKTHGGFLEFVKQTTKYGMKNCFTEPTEYNILMYLLIHKYIRPDANTCLGLLDMYYMNVKNLRNDRYDDEVTETMIIAAIVNKKTSMFIDMYTKRMSEFIYKNIHLLIEMGDIDMFVEICSYHSEFILFGKSLSDETNAEIVSKLVEFGNAEFMAKVLGRQEICLKFSRESFYRAIQLDKQDMAKLILNKLHIPVEFLKDITEKNLHHLLDINLGAYGIHETLFYAVKENSVPLFQYVLSGEIITIEDFNDYYIGLACCTDSYEVLKEIIKEMEKHGKKEIKYIDSLFAMETSVRCFELIFPYINPANSKVIGSFKFNKRTEIADMLKNIQTK